jgi:hypothetical protein
MPTLAPVVPSAHPNAGAAPSTPGAVEPHDVPATLRRAVVALRDRLTREVDEITAARVGAQREHMRRQGVALLQVLVTLGAELEELAAVGIATRASQPRTRLLASREFVVAAAERLAAVLTQSTDAPALTASACAAGERGGVAPALTELYIGPLGVDDRDVISVDPMRWVTKAAVTAWTALPAAEARRHPLYANGRLRWRLDCDALAQPALQRIAAAEDEERRLTAERITQHRAEAAVRQAALDRTQATRAAALRTILPAVDADLSAAWDQEVLTEDAAVAAVGGWCVDRLRDRIGVETLVILPTASMLDALAAEYGLDLDHVTTGDVPRVDAAAARRWRALDAALRASRDAVGGHTMSWILGREFRLETALMPADDHGPSDGGAEVRATTARLRCQVGPFGFMWDILLATTIET